LFALKVVDDVDDDDDVDVVILVFVCLIDGKSEILLSQQI
jgi:hypothetical protein